MPWFDESHLRGETQRGVIEEIWVRCQRCRAHVWKQDYQEHLHVCLQCGWHGKLTAWERIDLTVDQGTFEEIDASITPCDPLSFVDGKGRYADRIEEARRKTGLREAVVTGTGRIGELPAVIAVMDFRFLGGSLGSGTGEKILRAANHARARRLPYVVFSASGGARMQEGMLSLMQMAKTCAGIARLHESRLPYVSVLTDPTTAGVSASFAMVGDVNLAEPGALVGFAGRRVIEQTIHQELPEDAQTAEAFLRRGFIDRVVHRKDMKATLRAVLSYDRRRGAPWSESSSSRSRCWR